MRVRVPATSANLGPGFDCLGVAWQSGCERKACGDQGWSHQDHLGIVKVWRWWATEGAVAEYSGHGRFGEGHHPRHT